MTWWSEHSAVPRLVLAKLAIRCRFVDRFVGSRVPSRVAGQRFSPRGASLPSVGSRRARFPVLIGTTKALRLPARANLLPYVFGCRPHAPLLCSCVAEALLTGLEEARLAWNTWSAAVRARHVAPVGACGISQVSWRPILCLCPVPRPRPSRQNLAFRGLANTAPGLPKPKASACT
jgi:hypothetical protein